MEINQESLAMFRSDLKDALKPLERKYGITLDLGRITYMKESFTARLTATNGSSKGDVERNNFDSAVWKYQHLGLAKGMYNRLFIGADGKTYALQGFQPRARKYPLIVCDVKTGERAVAGEGFIRTLLNDFYTDVTVSATDAEDDPLLLEGTVISIEDLK